MNRSENTHWSSRIVIALAVTLMLTGCNNGPNGAAPAPLPGAPTSSGTLSSGPSAPATTGTSLAFSSSTTDSAAQDDSTIELTDGDSSSSSSTAGTGDSQAAAEAKLDVYFLSFEGCTPCKVIKAGAWKDGKSEYAGVINFHEIDVLKDPEAGKRYGYNDGDPVPKFTFWRDDKQVPDLTFTGAVADKLKSSLSSLAGDAELASASGYSGGSSS